MKLLLCLLLLACTTSEASEFSLMSALKSLFASGDLWCLLLGINCPDPTTQRLTTFGTFQVLETVPHDGGAFTQGLATVLDSDGSLKLVEGTGIRGNSELRVLDIDTGAVLQARSIPNAYFGEGVVHWRDDIDDNVNILQLTWQLQTAFEYDLSDTLTVSEPIGTFTFSTTRNEGWGITYGQNEFYVTDGSEYLHTWDFNTRQETGKVPVTYQPANLDRSPQSIANLNELEYDPFTNTVLANVWMTDDIVRIDPETGFCVTIYDLSSLFPRASRPAGTNVLNGIALTYDASIAIPDNVEPDVFWVTGKYWPTMFKIRLIDEA